MGLRYPSGIHILHLEEDPVKSLHIPEMRISPWL